MLTSCMIRVALPAVDSTAWPFCGSASTTPSGAAPAVLQLSKAV